MAFSVLRGPGFRAGFASMDYRLESADEKEGETRCCICNESGNIVGFNLSRKTPKIISKSSKRRRSLHSQDHLFSCIVCKGWFYLWGLYHTASCIMANVNPWIGELAPLLWWAAIEDGLAITAASIPALKPILIRVFPGSSSRENYDMISYPPRPSQQKIFDNSQGETQTDIAHTSIRERGSQTAILEPQSPRKRDETINLTTEVSVTYDWSLWVAPGYQRVFLIQNPEYVSFPGISGSSGTWCCQLQKYHTRGSDYCTSYQWYVNLPPGLSLITPKYISVMPRDYVVSCHSLVYTIQYIWLPK